MSYLIYKINKLTSDMEEKAVPHICFYVFLAKIVVLAGASGKAERPRILPCQIFHENQGDRDSEGKNPCL
jgi:hypothetical protein